MADDLADPSGGGPADAVTKPVSTAATQPEPPVWTPEMERFLSQPFTASELDDARRTSILSGRAPKANGK
jgi:hypothetical protein